jgi:predicted AlkP superfamily phosphohydrolase/phosphomutase
MIGLDGATFDLLDPLVEHGVMPFLGEFLGRGTRARLRSTPTFITPQAWTSLATGRSPGSHGIFDFVRPEETDAGVYIKLLGSSDVQCETIWSMASRSGRTVTLLNFPLTYPAPRVSGFVVPAFVTARHLRRAVRPPDLYHRLNQIPGFDAADLAMDLELEKKGVQGLPEADYEAWILAHMRHEAQWFKVLRHLMRNDPTDLTAIVFDGPDRIGHLAWRLIDPGLLPASPTSWEQRIRDLCLRYFRQLDSFLAEIIDDAGPEATIYIVSDHGFGPTHDIFYVNRWLEQQGYLHWGSAGAPVDDSESMLPQQMKAQYNLIDWKRTVAYALTPSANGIHIRVADRPGRNGVAPARYDSLRDEIVAGLGTVVDPLTGEPIVREVHEREEIFAGSQMSRAPDLTLVLRDFGFVSVLNSDLTVKQRQQAKGLHRPDGIFIAAGPGIRRGAAVKRLSIMDVAPALLRSMELPAPPDFDGRLPTEIFQVAPDLDRAAGSATRSDVAASDADGSDSGYTGDEEDLVLSRLRALGYLE